MSAPSGRLHLGGFGSFGHLAARFAGSLWPGPPSVAGEAWARHWLSPAEQALWARQSNQDRRHAIGVAHDVASALGDRDGAGVPRAALVAALLHDVGKVASELGTFLRVGATVVAGVWGRERVAAWAASSASCASSGESAAAGWRGRFGQYVSHDALGAALLGQAGSDPFVVTWAREHHQPETTWTLDPVLTAVLKAADGD